uniref:Wide awake, isoform D n=2 Tax=Drosophila melanogaster TaxID=7227 RepID=A0A0B4K6D0_DROME|nr:wide awake, isoform D [Drosophila melanogaster]NP_001247245.1 wide awake, isoform E [Drosophila melanogaster]AFH06562.1 wide awake, isoform D [Drosophila melanogaster]AFH06563.1 wide awake, isoform E [Drosophila melanogaster]|eukprot:NP_001247244.1 wide awake, isoform D [Drosophila melanogaster]
MNRCYHSDSTKLPNMPQKLPMSSCLRSPAVFVRQKSFHTLNELTRFCQLKVSPHRSTATATSTSSSPSSSPAAAQQQRRHSHYAIDDNILPQDKRDGDIDSVRLREKVVNPSGGNNNNQDNYPTYYPAPLLSTSRWSEQLTQHAAVAKIRTAISCHSQDLREMEFLLPHSRTDSQSNSQSQLCISRHSQPKNAKLRDDHDETGSSELDSPPLGDENASANGQLSVHRQPVQLRSKIPGNTPHPRASKMSKKQLKLAQAQLDKLTQNNLHLHALFSAVEHGHLEKARTILESTDVDVNSINNDGLSALDLAVLSNNRSMTRMLLQHGAVEGSQFSVDTIGTKLNGLLKDAESRIHDLSGPEGLCPPVFASRPSISSIIIGNSSASVTGCTGSEVEKQIGIWERRVKGLRRLQLGWDQARPPDAPASVVVDVTGDNSISVQILEPFEGAIGTKFKVQWSTRADFNNVVGESELLEWISFHGTMGAQCHISGLTQGRRYFLRAACGNVKGWGTYRTSVPASVVPSTWRDLDNREDRFVGRHRILDNLFTAVRLARPADVSELTLDPASAQRRNPKKKTTIKQLFSVTTKFQKTLRRGIYFSCIIHCDDKVLVTSEDFPPVIEVDESYPSALHMDYYWLMKVACTWEDVKSLRSDMERNLTSAVHFRTKLLSAVCQMQSALGITDLGQLYYKPLRDAQGTVVLTCVQSVKSQKAVSILNSRWVPVSKLQKKLGALHEDYTINELLISSIGDQLHYQQAALQRLEPGLYLGYLKMQCSIDQIQVVVPVKTPNVLPHCKVRENSHITAEEWQVLHRYSSDPLRLPLDFSAQGGDGASGATATTEVQRLFLYDLTNAMHKLFASMNIKIADATTHRLYDVEVIEHSPDISFLVVCPSAESSCAVPGQSELLLQRDDLASLSIQAFEMIHLRTYQPAIIQKYARLSCILELDTALATHSLREAFSSSELQAAKERLATLQELSASLTIVWKSVRWLMDVVAYARNKNAQPSLAMREILDFAQQRQDEAVATSAGGSANKQLLQLPIRESKFSKTGQGRGSWPGPGTSEDQSQNKPEHSKSEQNLELSAITPVEPASNQVPTQQQQPQQQSQQQQLLQVSNISEYAGSICSEVSFRKNSGDSMSSTYTSRSFYSAVDSASDGNSTNSVFAIPPSRSDDTLADALRHSQAVAAQRKRTSSNIASHTNPLITVHSSSSAPYLAGSSVSLRSGNGAFATDLEHKPLKPATKAASSANLREGGPYLKSTLAELRAVGGEEPVASTSKASSMKSLSRQSSEEDSASCSSLNAEQTSGIIQVYTAYSTGLASGTSLKIHVTPKTTAREVINLVVKQLNMAVVLKGNNGPIYGPEMLENFCLVAVIGARERCLRDDFKPLQLQNPWKKGRLYVRKKHELLAAIEHSNRKSHLI